MIALSENEERLLEALRALPPETADTVIKWATQLSDLAKGRPVDWSDSWTEEGLASLQNVSIANFEAREPAPKCSFGAIGKGLDDKGPDFTDLGQRY